VTGLDWRPLAEADPVPGDPQAVRELAAGYARAAALVGEQAGSVRRVDSAADWDGAAAQAFRARVGDLPRDLDRVAARLQHVARALLDFAPALESAQRRARSALARAQEAQTRAGVSAQVPAASWPALLPGTLSPAEREMRAAVEGAARLLATAVEERQVAVARCVGALHRAGDDQLRNPHGWHRLLLAVSNIAGQVSTWLGVAAVALCWVPGLGEALGAVALSAAGVTLLADLLLTAYGDRGWRSVGLDAVGVLPAGRALRFASTLPREVTGVRAVVRAAMELHPAGEVREGVRDLRTAMSRASWPAFLRSRGGLLDDIARARELRRGGAAMVLGSEAIDVVHAGVGVYAQLGAGGRS
jgi:uncharacterized protein YukE